MKEEKRPQDQISSFLTVYIPAMLGLLVGENDKHAVVFMDQASNAFRIINNRHPSTLEPHRLTLTAAELLPRTNLHVYVTMLAHITPEPVDMKPLLTALMDTLADYRWAMDALRQIYFDRPRLLSLMNTHFRACCHDSSDS